MGDLNFGHLNKFSIFAIYYYLFALQFCALQDLLLQNASGMRSRVLQQEPHFHLSVVLERSLSRQRS